MEVIIMKSFKNLSSTVPKNKKSKRKVWNMLLEHLLENSNVPEDISHKSPDGRTAW